MPNALSDNALLRHLYFDTPPPDTLKAPEQTFGQKVGNYASNALHSVGLSQRMADKAANLVDYSPVGVATTAMQMGADLRRQKWGSAAANALSTAANLVPDAKVAGAAVHAVIAPLWHGSPHAFEKFAMEKIGTGEGAQAYGHGLYFAENPEVARQYQSTVSLQRAGVDWGNDPASAAAYWIGMSKDRDAAIRTFETMKAQHQKTLDRAAKGLPLAPGAEANSRNEIAQANAAIEHIRNGTEQKGLGHLYEVKLDANPEDFLNWDAPLSGQPDAIRSAYADAAMPARKTDPLLADLFGTGPVPNGYLGLFDKSTGAQAYNTLANNTEFNAQRMATDRLKQAGIPGIRYLDQGSRGAGQGTSNYVVFDPSLIDILAKH